MGSFYLDRYGRIPEMGSIMSYNYSVAPKMTIEKVIGGIRMGEQLNMDRKTSGFD